MAYDVSRQRSPTNRRWSASPRCVLGDLLSRSGLGLPKDELPFLEGVTALPRMSTQVKVVLAYIAAGSLNDGAMSVSQRYMAMTFNRTTRKSVAAWTRKLVDLNLITVKTYSSALQPNAYRLAETVMSDPNLLEAISGLASALFGIRGLLTDWRYPASLGHGALNASGSLVLAVLTRIRGPVRQNDLFEYLQPLVSRQTAARIIKKAETAGLVRVQDRSISLVPDWESRLQLFLRDCPAGDERLHQGNEQRRLEWDRARQQLRAGCLTDFEVSRLLNRKCVFCQGPSSEQEHFPPRRFLDYHGLSEDRLHLWAVCRTCNSERSAFIRRLPFRRLTVPCDFRINNLSDVPIIAVVNANHHLTRFNRAFKNGDVRGAVFAIYAVLTMIVLARKLDVDLNQPLVISEPRAPRRRPQVWSTEDSQMTGLTPSDS